MARLKKSRSAMVKNLARRRCATARARGGRHPGGRAASTSSSDQDLRAEIAHKFAEIHRAVDQLLDRRVAEGMVIMPEKRAAVHDLFGRRLGGP